MREQIIIQGKTYKSQKELKSRLTDRNEKMGFVNSIKTINPAYCKWLLEFIKRHPKYHTKYNNVVDFKLVKNMTGQKELNVINENGSSYAISINTCITKKLPTDYSQYKDACRSAIESQIYEYRQNNDMSICHICEKRIDSKLEIDHVITFRSILDDFDKEFRFDIPKEYSKDKYNKVIFRKEDEEIGKKFAEFHKNVCKLKPSHKLCNVGRNKKFKEAKFFELDNGNSDSE